MPQAAIRFREPGWHGPLDLQTVWQGLPSVPDGVILMIKPVNADDQTAGRVTAELIIQLLNAGPQRVKWHLKQGWATPTGEGIIGLMPGELKEVRLLRQSS